MEILIWGDNMKRQISVSIFLAIILILFVLLYIRFRNETKLKEESIYTENEISKEEAVPISQEQITSKFYIKENHGRLVVFQTKNGEIYMETSIEFQTLPNELQDKIMNGIFFQSESDLYDFLESYSS